MLGAAIATKVTKRLSRGLPLVQLWTAGQLALLAGRHLSNLDGPQRRRLATLVGRGRGRPSKLSDAEATELRDLVQRLQVRVFAGDAVSRLSPVPVPKRVRYGKRESPARVAVADRKREQQGTPAGHDER